MTVLILCGAIVIAVLVVTAIYYQVLLYKKTQTQKTKSKELEQLLQERHGRNKESIVILARAVLDDQVTLTEACIRINALSQALPLEEEVMQELRVFQKLAEATQHIPILEKWKALSRKEKQQFDKERESIEAKFKDFVHAASEKIAHHNLLRK
ncbi:MAG: DUF2489 domain-containing protein [Agarilytica sp.]